MTRAPLLLLFGAACGGEGAVKANNAAPVAAIDGLTEGATVEAGVVLPLVGTVSDPDDAAETLTATWFLGEDVICPALAPGPEGQTLCEVTLPEGEATIRLEVRDPEDATASASVTVSAVAEVVVTHTAPTCTLLAPEDGQRFAPGEAVDFAATVADAETAPASLQVQWTSSRDGLINADAPGVNGDVAFQTADLSEGTHDVALLVTDSDGETCTAEVRIAVGDGPLVTFLSPADGARYNQGETLAFEATVASDTTAAEDLALLWTSDLDGPLNAGPADASGGAAFSTSALSGGLHVIALTATDADGDDGSASILLTINGWPGAPGVSITPAAPTPEDDLALSLDTPSTDPEGSAVHYTYAWTCDGVLSAYDTPTIPEFATEDGQTWSVTVTPDDGETSGPSATATATIGNEAPVLSAVTLSPDPAYEGDTLSCTAGEATDADGDATSFIYAWTVGGAAVSASGDTLLSSDFHKNQDVICTVTPTDGLSTGRTVSSNVVTVRNSLPVASAVSISPASPTASSVLTCSYVFSDADSDLDLSTFSWTVDGLEVGSGPVLSGAFGGGDLVVCTVSPDDGEETGTAVSASVSVGNSAPVLSGVTLTPAPAYEGDTLTCTPGSATDADGDDITYTTSWVVSGSTLATTESTLSSDAFKKGDTVRCVVTPSDGRAAGTAVSSATVTVANSLPVLSTVTLSPTAPVTDSTLTPSFSCTDADGDTIGYSYVWKVNGVLSSTAATLGGSAFGRDDVVSIAVTPSDGTATGTAGTASVTILNSAPSAPSVAIAPTEPEAGVDDLLCDVVTESADADRDAITYAVTWSADGRVYPDAFAGTTGPTTNIWTDDTIPAVDTDLATRWTCTATPDDGVTEGSASSASAEVLDFYDIGNDTALDAESTSLAGYMNGVTLTVPKATTVYKMGVVMWRGGTKIQMALYTDSGGRPGTLVAYTGLNANVTGTNEFDVVSDTTVAAGTYWIMAAYNVAGNPWYTTATSKISASKSYTAGSTPTTTFGLSSTACCTDFSYYLVVAD